VEQRLRRWRPIGSPFRLAHYFSVVVGVDVDVVVSVDGDGDVNVAE
jgi:hypothetical protein